MSEQPPDIGSDELNAERTQPQADSTDLKSVYESSDEVTHRQDKCKENELLNAEVEALVESAANFEMAWFAEKEKVNVLTEKLAVLEAREHAADATHQNERAQVAALTEKLAKAENDCALLVDQNERIAEMRINDCEEATKAEAKCAVLTENFERAESERIEWVRRGEAAELRCDLLVEAMEKITQEDGDDIEAMAHRMSDIANEALSSSSPRAGHGE